MFVFYCSSAPLSSKTFFPNPILVLLWTESAQEPVVRNVQVTSESSVSYFVSSLPYVHQLKRKKHPADSIIKFTHCKIMDRKRSRVYFPFGP